MKSYIIREPGNTGIRSFQETTSTFDYRFELEISQNRQTSMMSTDRIPYAAYNFGETIVGKFSVGKNFPISSYMI